MTGDLMRPKCYNLEEVLEKGSAVMHLNGYHGTGLKDLLAAAGMPKGSFYNYFESKQDFAVQAIAYHSEKYRQMLDALSQDQSLEPLQRLQRMFADMIGKYQQQGTYERGCFAGNLCQEMGDCNLVIAEAVEQGFACFETFITDCLVQAQKQQALADTIDCVSLAQFLLNSWEGALMRMKVKRSDAPLRAFQQSLCLLLG